MKLYMVEIKMVSFNRHWVNVVMYMGEYLWGRLYVV